ncbi:MAG: hypothetical protein Q4D81_12785 [Eubacteriales bacterium]|nr:hypothetical protein [Eubacteriales bacterium]
MRLSSENRSKSRACSFFHILAVLLAMSFLTVFTAPVTVQAAPVEALQQYRVRVDSDYLALRTTPGYREDNEIARLYTGDPVIRCIRSDEAPGFFYVYSPQHQKSGYVNCTYLEYNGLFRSTCKKVKIDSGYLAVSTSKDNDSRNEIGKLYTGDIVITVDGSDPEYTMVYSQKLKAAGYVKSKYLQGAKESVRAPEAAADVAIKILSDSRLKQKKSSGGRLKVSVEVKNVSKQKTVTGFEVLLFAHDRNGGLVFEGETYIYPAITKKTLKSGESAYTDYVKLDKRDQIETVFAMPGRIWFSDGSVSEYPVYDGANVAAWTVER